MTALALNEIDITSKNIFATLKSQLFQNKTLEDLTQTDYLKASCELIQDFIVLKKGLHPLECILIAQSLTLQENAPLNVYIRMNVATEKGKTVRVKRIFKTDDILSDLYPIILNFRRNPYQRASDPMHEFIKDHHASNHAIIRFEYFPDVKRWIEQTLENDVITEAMSQRNEDDMKSVLKLRMDSGEITSQGLQVVKAFKEFHRNDFEVLPFEPTPFPDYGLQRVKALAEHEELIHKEAEVSCSDCRLGVCWKINHDWYTQIFFRQREVGTIIGHDGTLRPHVMRKKALVVLGTRETGKTIFFSEFCRGDPKHFAHITHKFTRENTKTLSANTWLLMLDDFTWNEKDKEMLKSILSSQRVPLDGKWLDRTLPQGIPCVVLMNNRTLYNELMSDPIFADQCIFNDMEDFKLCPVNQLNDHLRYTGRMRSLQVSEHSAMNVFIHGSKDGKPNMIPMQEYREIVEKYQKTSKEVNKLKEHCKRLKRDHDELLKSVSIKQHFEMNEEGERALTKKMKVMPTVYMNKDCISSTRRDIGNDDFLSGGGVNKE